MYLLAAIWADKKYGWLTIFSNLSGGSVLGLTDGSTGGSAGGLVDGFVLTTVSGTMSLGEGFSWSLPDNPTDWGIVRHYRIRE